MIGRMAEPAPPTFGRVALAPPPLPFATGAEASARGQCGSIGPAGRPLQGRLHIVVKENQGRTLGIVPVVPIFEKRFGNCKALIFQVSSRCSRCYRSILYSTRARASHIRRRNVVGNVTHTRVTSMRHQFFTGNNGNNGNSLVFNSVVVPVRSSPWASEREQRELTTDANPSIA